MTAENTIVINGNAWSFEPGETILEVARRNDIDIPTLCHLKGANPTGVCRVCVVEVEGAKKLMASCATPVVAGMVVQTESAKVVEARKMIIQLMLSSGNHNCAIRGHAGNDWTAFQLKVQEDDASGDLCPVWGDCRLQDLAYRYQVSGDPELETDIPYPMETVNPFIVRDFSRCILCGRCVQACNDIQVNNAIDFGYQSGATKIVARDDKPLKDSDCVFCGECVQVCPVGALVEKDARYGYRPWEDRQVRTTCSYCGVGCQIDLHVKDDRVVKVTGVEDAAPNYGSLCVKGRFGFDFIHSPERLTRPLVRKDGEFEEASWDEALDLVADRLGAIKNDPRTGQHRRAHLGPGHQRGELHRPEIHPGGAQNQQRRPLRPSLTQLHRGRSGRSLRKRRHDEHHRRHRDGRRDPRHRLQHHGKPSGALQLRQAGRQTQRGQADRGGSPADQDRRIRHPLAPPQPGHRRGLDQRHDARHPQGKPLRRGISSRSAPRISRPSARPWTPTPRSTWKPSPGSPPET